MTVIAVLADPPREGLVLPELVETSPLSESEVASLYTGILQDTMQAAVDSGGELLVNFRPDDLLPEEHQADVTSEAELRAVAKQTLDDIEDVRFEQQVGSTFEARAGNTATHLLEQEDVASVAIVEPTTPMLSRTQIDSAAMKLRRSEVVLGPAEYGRVYFVGLTDTINFEGAYTPPEIESLVNRARDADHQVDFLPQFTRLETESDLVSIVTTIRARRSAGVIIPEHTAAVIDELGLRVEVADGDRRLARD